ncbi:phosphoribosyltransferase [Dyadobacter chenhuakuii]|uniref:Phosphoribosyltransferase n=1 Tax=Dyadobacter chenhuakuii TaxID=2909339 RepID=A0A9X1QGT9_9BACT|nr:phosphoribosyltransferase [Dyadobacter chenhuakuii]MCF2501688.1 phosphoribosyltransferase [Dyadobacter chenhuakuii]
MNRLLVIDEFLLPDHTNLDPWDQCYYIMNYIPGKRLDYNAENQLIHNFKKSLEYRGSISWGYKVGAINKFCQIFREVILPTISIPHCTLVPIPPSKTKQNQLYDDRMIQVLNEARNIEGSDVRELIYLLNDMVPMHNSTRRRSVDELLVNLAIDQSLINGIRENIILFDDMITTGAHFIACKRLLQQTFPNVNVIGIFLSRRDPDPLELFSELV